MVVYNMINQVNISSLGNKVKKNGMKLINFAPINVTLGTRAIPWRKAFSEYNDTMIAGVSLKETRKMAELTQQQMSQLTGVPLQHISEMESGKRTISDEIAKMFAEVLNVDHRVFL